MSVASPVISHIDPAARLIYLAAGVREYHPVDDIYKEVRNLRRLDETLRPFDQFVSAGGNVKKLADGSKRTPRYAIFNNCQVVPADDVDHDLTITGEQLYKDTIEGEPTGVGSACINKTPLTVRVSVDYAPAEAEVIVVGGNDPLETEIEGNFTTKEVLRIMLAAVAGEGGPNGSDFVYKDLAGLKNRIVATIDPQGNRTSVTLDGSD